MKLVALYGAGDVYLATALFPAFAARYGATSLVIRRNHAVLAEMFGVPHEVDDDLVEAAEARRAVRPDHVYAHPSFGGGRLDDLTTRPGHVSQADMYRALLGLSLDAPLANPIISTIVPIPRRALLVTAARSWTNTQAAFWSYLADALKEAGWRVIGNDITWNLRTLLEECAASALVCAPQCGVISILCEAQYSCAKAILTPSLEGTPGLPVGNQLVRHTYPYAYTSRFAGRSYRALERRLTDDNFAEVSAAVLRYAAQPHDPRPVTMVAAPMSPGDFLDRAAVLEVKVRRLGAAGPAEEHARYREILAASGLSFEFFERLVVLHSEIWDLMNAARGPEVAANARRVAMRREIDDAIGAPWSEVKSYS